VEPPTGGGPTAVKEITRMSDTNGVRLGKKVPELELTVYDPVKDDFGKFSLADQIAKKRWTILFFYPADFTFV
jgi:alkyl hydroperoxide reductase subunit AhpC